MPAITDKKKFSDQGPFQSRAGHCGGVVCSRVHLMSSYSISALVQWPRGGRGRPAMRCAPPSHRINAAIDYMRREMNNQQTYAIPEHIWEHKDNGQSSDNSLLYKELMCLVKELPPAYRMVFNLHVIEGYSHPEIAKMLGITTGTSKSNLSKARVHLQKALTSENSEFSYEIQ